MTKAIRTVLITGATGKLGRQLSGCFLAEGHTVVATSRRSDALDELAARHSGLPGRLEGVVTNLLEESGDSLASRLAERDLQPDAIVNNAIDISNQSLPTSGLPSRAQWRIELELAVAIPLDITMAFATLPGTRLTSVVNVASMYGMVARNPSLYLDPIRESPIHYGVAKAAMIHLTKELAVRLAPRGIRVNAVSFGGVEGRVDAAFKERYARLCPSARMLREDEVTEPVAFLLSSGASGLTGHNLVVDGGWTLW